MKPRTLTLYLLAALGCFAVGLAAARWLSPPPRAPMEPQIFIDPHHVQLLPDASLRLDLPAGFDAGAP